MKEKTAVTQENSSRRRGNSYPQYTLAGDEPLYKLIFPLSEWYRAVARPLPWREDPTPYHVWISEVMLQQTRVEAVKPYYARFLAVAPDIASLASLPEDRLMKLWEGLGYYSRARHLKQAAELLMEKYGGEMPGDYPALLSLPGVGEYTAGAISSIAFGLPFPAVDGNVLRVFARLCAEEGEIGRPEIRGRIAGALSELYAHLPPRKEGDPAGRSPAGILTQAWMELGQVLCTPGASPRCEECPLCRLCRGREEGRAGALPVRTSRTTRRILHRLVLVLCDADGRYAVRRRPKEGLLAGLWELPALDLPDGQRSIAELEEEALTFCTAHGLVPGEMADIGKAQHLFTHLEWQMQGLFLNVKRSDAEGSLENGTSPGLTFVRPEELRERYALPTAYRAYVRYITGQH